MRPAMRAEDLKIACGCCKQALVVHWVRETPFEIDAIAWVQHGDEHLLCRLGPSVLHYALMPSVPPGLYVDLGQLPRIDAVDTKAYIADLHEAILRANEHAAQCRDSIAAMERFIAARGGRA